MTASPASGSTHFSKHTSAQNSGVGKSTDYAGTAAPNGCRWSALRLEQPHLLAPPTALYEIPHWCDPKVGRDHLAQVAKALYSLPTRFIGKHLRARADRTLVCFYDQGKLVKTHARQSPGGRSIDPIDFPAHKSAYAMRDIGSSSIRATQHGAAIGLFAHQVREGPLPWTRMRRVYALLALVRRYGESRVEQTCRLALDAQMFDVRRLERMLQAATTVAPTLPSPTTQRPHGIFGLPANTPFHSTHAITDPENKP